MMNFKLTLLIAVAIGCLSVHLNGQKVEMWSSDPVQEIMLVKSAEKMEFASISEDTQLKTINVDHTEKYQLMEGFGASLTGKCNSTDFHLIFF